MPDDTHGSDQSSSPSNEVTAKFRPVPANISPRLESADAETTATIQVTSCLSSSPLTFPGYDIVGELGRGGMGVVYKAWEVRAKRFVALKMIVPGTEAEPKMLKRFQAEGQAVAQLNHPNIVRVFEIGEYRGWPYFSLELCGGGSLAKKLAGNPMQSGPTVELMEKVARAIGYAHQQRIIHRDLKPANILLTADGEPKIADFGLAKQLDHNPGNSRIGAIMGTVNYIPPEQAIGTAKTVGPSADIYALGAILYECLTGRPPFKGASVIDTLDQVRLQEVIPPRLFERKIPRDLETICLTCLQRDASKRYPSALDLADDLMRLRMGRPIVARSPGFLKRAVSWASRNPLAAVCGIVLVAAFAVSIAGSLAYLRIRG